MQIREGTRARSPLPELHATQSPQRSLACRRDCEDVQGRPGEDSAGRLDDQGCAGPQLSSGSRRHRAGRVRALHRQLQPQQGRRRGDEQPRAHGKRCLPVPNGGWGRGFDQRLCTAARGVQAAGQFCVLPVPAEHPCRPTQSRGCRSGAGTLALQNGFGCRARQGPNQRAMAGQTAVHLRRSSFLAKWLCHTLRSSGAAAKKRWSRRVLGCGLTLLHLQHQGQVDAVAHDDVAQQLGFHPRLDGELLQPEPGHACSIAADDDAVHVGSRWAGQ